jgi:hypothetical protein
VTDRILFYCQHGPGITGLQIATIPWHANPSSSGGNLRYTLCGTYTSGRARKKNQRSATSITAETSSSKRSSYHYPAHRKQLGLPVALWNGKGNCSGHGYFPSMVPGCDDNFARVSSAEAF